MRQLSLPSSLSGVRGLAPAAIIVAFTTAAFAIWLPGSADHGQAAVPQTTTIDSRLAARSERLSALIQDTDTRPVFHGSRRPVQSAAAPAAPEPVLSLLGVISDGGEKIAFVRISTGAALYSVGAGDTVGAWRILKIGTESVQVSKNGAAPFTLRID
ncbi:MAG: hypothetical protein AAF771_11355 [Pseudomonadota bacterium]